MNTKENNLRQQSSNRDREDILKAATAAAAAAAALGAVATDGGAGASSSSNISNGSGGGSESGSVPLPPLMSSGGSGSHAMATPSVLRRSSAASSAGDSGGCGASAAILVGPSAPLHVAKLQNSAWAADAAAVVRPPTAAIGSVSGGGGAAGPYVFRNTGRSALLAAAEVGLIGVSSLPTPSPTEQFGTPYRYGAVHSSRPRVVEALAEGEIGSLAWRIIVRYCRRRMMSAVFRCWLGQIHRLHTARAAAEAMRCKSQLDLLMAAFTGWLHRVWLRRQQRRNLARAARRRLRVYLAAWREQSAAQADAYRLWLLEQVAAACPQALADEGRSLMGVLLRRQEEHQARVEARQQGETAVEAGQEEEEVEAEEGENAFAAKAEAEMQHGEEEGLEGEAVLGDEVEQEAEGVGEGEEVDGWGKVAGAVSGPGIEMDLRAKVELEVDVAMEMEAAEDAEAERKELERRAAEAEAETAEEIGAVWEEAMGDAAAGILAAADTEFRGVGDLAKVGGRLGLVGTGEVVSAGLGSELGLAAGAAAALAAALSGGSVEAAAEVDEVGWEAAAGVQEDRADGGGGGWVLEPVLGERLEGAAAATAGAEWGAAAEDPVGEEASLRMGRAKAATAAATAAEESWINGGPESAPSLRPEGEVTETALVGAAEEGGRSTNLPEGEGEGAEGEVGGGPERQSGSYLWTGKVVEEAEDGQELDVMEEEEENNGASRAADVHLSAQSGLGLLAPEEAGLWQAADVGPTARGAVESGVAGWGEEADGAGEVGGEGTPSEHSTSLVGRWEASVGYWRDGPSPSPPSPPPPPHLQANEVEELPPHDGGS
ncbi:hypothetical protein VOLCADRAFT_97425 [Volvox carteri f. nagariensis]|uniref:Sfi1 spindle body domain-containing protein n=1 Tax=Volvox carteri f. nagariensis TaxID=3068 RepID=D8UCQ7_VOLCA|nr:uncharacterized protein VOLCADRAFT_97425 [Volvox carteri f. nagariensis]EFJ42593.1 hypothetical protein VOLCADRAFT_97425 [Volvox carteri f. nagariensis]|eukprot:XP_002956449.1 hypothetical protein VOLCADRAFT_97425 [Volvox carteri f. nagariensis]